MDTTTGTPTTLGEWLAYLLGEAGWTGRELEAASGVSTDTIGHIVNGVVRAKRGQGRGPTRATLIRLATALAVRFDDLAAGGETRLTRADALACKRMTRHLLTAPLHLATPMDAHALVVAPTPLTPLVGRADLVARAGGFLRQRDVRLLTVTGPPGMGKTRLALAVVEEVRDVYPDGVYPVPLAPLGDAALVLHTVARMLGLREAPGRPVDAALVDYLRARRLLLLLDNMEHVAAAAPGVVGLLAACPGLTVLATSRAALRVDGEQELLVPPLQSPDPARSSVEDVARYPAVDLFVQRARAVAPDFALTPANAPTVAALCRRLDGLPLAIELAAARIRILPPRALLDRLDNRLQVLSGGAPHLPERQQTLRGALDWSYNLLTSGERALFRRLSVFAGGCSLDAAEVVCAAPAPLPLTVLDGLASLVDKSLVRAEGDGEGDEEPRFGMLETMRAYGLDRLAAAGEAAAAREGHAAYYLALAEVAEPELTGAEQTRWLGRLEAEHDNLRAALHWAREGGEPAVGVRLAAALWRFWLIHGHLSEGRNWLEELLANMDGADDHRAGPAGVPMGATGARATEGERERDALRAKALRGAGGLAIEQGDFRRAGALYEGALAVYRVLGDTEGAAAALNNLGVAADGQGNYGQAAALYAQSLTLKRDVGDTRGVANSLSNLGRLALQRGDDEQAVTLHEEGLALSRGLGDTGSVALSLNSLGEVALYQGAYERAAALLKESVALARAVGDKRGLAFALNNLGDVALRQGDEARATACQEESLAVRRALGNDEGVAVSLGGLGDIACARGDHRRAADAYAESLALLRASDDTALTIPVLEKVAALVGSAVASSPPPRPDALARAARLLGAAARLREEIDAPLLAAARSAHERDVAAVRAALGDGAFVAAWGEGRALTREHAIAVALDACRSYLS